MRMVAVALVTMILIPGFASGQSKTGTTIGQFLLIEPSARIAAMGNAGAALCEGIQSMYYNPAAVGLIERYEFQVSHSSWLADISCDYAALAFPMEKVGTFFVSLTSLNSGEIDVRTVEQPMGTGEQYTVENLAVAAGYGRRITERFAVGIQATYVEETIWHSSLRTVTLSVGTVYEVSEKGLRIGSSLLHYGTQGGYTGRDLRIQYDANPDIYGDNSSLPAEQHTENYPVPVQFRVGVAMPRQVNEDNRLLFAVEAIHPNDNSESLSAGAEWMWKDTIALRGGYQDYFQTDSEVGLTLGVGVHGRIDENVFSFDYAWADHGRLNETHRVSFVIGF